MNKLESTFELSVRRAVNINTIVLFIGFAIFLFWLSIERYYNYVDEHVDAADKAVHIAGVEIEKKIESKRRLVKIFSEDYYDDIVRLYHNPDNVGLYFELEEKIRRYFPDYFASNIINERGESIINNGEGVIGEFCLQDIQSYLKFNERIVRVHPSSRVYHFDVMSKFSTDGKNMLLFVSFDLNEVARILKASKPGNHELLLINSKMKSIIEVTPLGSRDKIKGREDYELTEAEKSRILGTYPIKGTVWDIIDMHETGLLERIRTSLTLEGLAIFFIFTLIMFYMRSIILNQDRVREAAEKKVKQNSNEINHLNEELKKTNTRLAMLSVTDDLTGLYNRRYFDMHMNTEWNRNMRSSDSITLIMLDVDYFKQYNDFYGHQEGDECLVKVANLMRKIFRRADDIVARYGGEEFVVLMTDIEKKDAIEVMKKFIDELAQLKIPHEKSTINDYVTVSAGLVSAIPTNDGSIRQLFNEVDEAMYKAKSSGRNQLVCPGCVA